MTTEPEIFLPGIVEQIPEPAPKANPWPYFLVGYWPNGPWWKLFKATYKNVESMQNEITRLQNSGWTHITIMKLPELGRDAK